MIIVMPFDNSIVKWKNDDKDEWKIAEISDLIQAYENAPTVEPCYQTTSCLDCKNYDKENYYCPRFCEVIREATKEIKRQGEWIGNAFNEHHCNICGHPALWEEEPDDYYEAQSRFCPNCGAKMKGGAE